MKIFNFALLLGSLIRDATAEDFLAEILSGDLDRKRFTELKFRIFF